MTLRRAGRLIEVQAVLDAGRQELRRLPYFATKLHELDEAFNS